MPFRLAWREAPDVPLAAADVPHLVPIARAVEAGRDGLVRLPDGRRLRPSAIVSVAEIDDAGRTVRAWEVRSHGLEGRHDWRQTWREVATATYGITQKDARWLAIIDALDALDSAYRRRDTLAWQAARARLHRALAGQTTEVA